MCIKSVFELFVFISSLTKSLEHIFRNSVYFLLVPKESRRVRSLICAVDYYSSTFISSLNSCFLINTVLWFYSCRTKSWTASAKKYHKHLNISIECWKNYSQKNYLRQTCNKTMKACFIQCVIFPALRIEYDLNPDIILTPDLDCDRVTVYCNAQDHLSYWVCLRRFLWLLPLTWLIDYFCLCCGTKYKLSSDELYLSHTQLYRV